MARFGVSVIRKYHQRYQFSKQVLCGSEKGLLPDKDKNFMNEAESLNHDAFLSNLSLRFKMSSNEMKANRPLQKIKPGENKPLSVDK